MDPGNWATDLEGGASFGYQLLWVLVASNLVALLLQTLSAKLGIVAGLDLASACRLAYAPATSTALWILAEISIVACDMAELLGSAIALQLLFHLPLVWGALVTSVDVLVILALQRRGATRLEAFVVVLLFTIAVCLGIEVYWAKPELGQMARGLLPRLGSESLYVAIGILGATVMPHNLYLHSGLLAAANQNGELGPPAAAHRRSIWSTVVALNLALLVNAAILLLAASTFGKRGLPVSDLRDAHGLLAPLLGSGAAAVLFAVGLLASGQSSTVTGTLAGQIVMEGFVQLRLKPWLRRAVTRGLAIVPAVAVLSAVGDAGVMPLLVGSQVVLSIQLPFAIVPLIRLTSSPSLMRGAHSGPWLRRLAVGGAALIALANTVLVIRTVQQLASSSPWVALLLGGLECAGLAFLVRISCVPLKLGPTAASSSLLAPAIGPEH
jgi:manganese transport protein